MRRLLTDQDVKVERAKLATNETTPERLRQVEDAYVLELLPARRGADIDALRQIALAAELELRLRSGTTTDTAAEDDDVERLRVDLLSTIETPEVTP